MGLSALGVVEDFLRQKSRVFEEIARGEELKRYFVGANLATVLFSLAYGSTMGLCAGGVQPLFSALKVPMLLLISMYISAPSYYVIHSILGGAFSLRQTLVLLASGLALTSCVLLALLPVSLFFILTTESYAFLVLLNVAIFALAGGSGLVFLAQGLARSHEKEGWVPTIVIGSLIYMLVGTQLAWVLRPYFHYYEGFIRPVRGNFYVAIFRLILRSIFRFPD